MIGGYSPEAKEKPLHDYQQKVAYWTLSRIFELEELGAGVFLDPGLGKTRTTLAVLDFLFQVGAIRKALIIGPLRPVYSVWPNEMKRWGFPQTYQILHGNTAKNLKSDAQIELMNYDSLHKIADLENRWDVVILDESTYIKNWSTNRTKNIKKLVKSIPSRVLLTGTPASNSLADLFPQMYIIDGGEALGKTVGGFRRNFCRPAGQQQWNKWVVKKQDQKRLQEAIKDKVIRLQAEDYLDMPDLIFNDVWFDLDDKTAALYRKLKRELFAELDSGDVTIASAAAAYGKCRQFANGHIYDQERAVHVIHKEKIRALMEVHEELAGKPLLVFYSFKHDLSQIQKGIGIEKPFRKVPVIQGGMKPAEVDKIIERWNGGEYHAILCQWKTVSHGTNLQGSCNDVACMGVVDSVETFEQAYRRVYRQGVQGNQVRIHRLLARDTVDEVMLERLNGRHQTNTEFLQALKEHAKTR
jgi:SNF2 family DNA or RNA helicase